MRGFRTATSNQAQMTLRRGDHHRFGGTPRARSSSVAPAHAPVVEAVRQRVRQRVRICTAAVERCVVERAVIRDLDVVQVYSPRQRIPGQCRRAGHEAITDRYGAERRLSHSTGQPKIERIFSSIAIVKRDCPIDRALKIGVAAQGKGRRFIWRTPATMTSKAKSPNCVMQSMRSPNALNSPTMAS